MANVGYWQIVLQSLLHRCSKIFRAVGAVFE
jgi:hypothetical protein